MTEASSLGVVVAEQIRRLRLRKGWSVRELAEACAKHGAAQLTQSSLYNIERGQEPTERAVLAVALGVPLLALLLPVDDEKGAVAADTVAVTPSDQVSWFTLAGWLRAQWHLHGDHRSNGLPAGWQIKNFFDVIDAYIAACDDEHDLHGRLIRQQVRPDSAEILRATEQMHAASLGRYLTALTELLDRSLTPPPPTAARRIIEGLRESQRHIPPSVETLFAEWEADDAGR
jgi:transcriptional regulator with XRE-family HTH domain